jgi:hypothetical protein
MTAEKPAVILLFREYFLTIQNNSANIDKEQVFYFLKGIIHVHY